MYNGLYITLALQIAEVINEALDDYFPDPNVHIISEPGRFYVSSAYTLACNIHSIRDVRSKTTTGNLYYLSESYSGHYT